MKKANTFNENINNNNNLSQEDNNALTAPRGDSQVPPSCCSAPRGRRHAPCSASHCASANVRACLRAAGACPRRWRDKSSSPPRALRTSC